MVLAALIVCGLFSTAISVAGANEASPEKMKMSFMMEGQRMSYNMEVNPHIDPNFPVILSKDGQFIHWNKNHTANDFAVYLDRENMASVLVRNVTMDAGDTESSFIGMFRVDDEYYMLEPATHPETARKKRSLNFDLGDMTNLNHVMYQPANQDMVFLNDSPVRTNATLYESAWAALGGTCVASADLLKQAYAVEMLLVLDYGIFENWLQVSGAGDAWLREKEAIDSIRYYFAHIVNGMDLRYQSIQEYDYSIHIRLSGMIIAMTPQDSYWTERAANRDPGYPRDFTHAYKALDDFEAWMVQYESVLPPFDQATLFTGNELFGSYRSDGSHREISGLADIKGVCNNLRASINQDNGQYASIQTAAHELGHNLGSYHDGSGNRCTGRDQYIMASGPGELTDAIYLNALTFSSCTIQAFREHLGLLTLENKNCLLNQVDHFNIDELLEQWSVQPGQFYSPDEQCRLIYGPESYYCAGASGDANICRKMSCFDPRQGKCYGHTEQRSAEGTTCGNRRWCILGDCVHDREAPEAADVCLYGDFVGVFSDGRTCGDVVRETPWECYRDHWGLECCRSCASIRDVTRPGCEYGDHERSCANLNSRDCYYENTNGLCCETCRLRQTGDRNCLYGDMASWCPTMAAGGCYTNNRTCCVTCPQRHNGNHACPYGDAVSWCPTQDRRNCYHNDHLCCESCQRHHTGIEGCEYGDTDRYCTLDYCKDPSRWDECCATCHDVIVNAAATTTTSTTTTTMRPTITTTMRSDTTSSPTSITTTMHPNTTTTISPTTTTAAECRDKASWCPPIKAKDCYVDDDVCCRTCMKHLTDMDDCKYGDMAGWCPSYVRGIEQCMVDDVSTRCCASCARFMGDNDSEEVEDPECPKGDTAPWCAAMPASDCYVPSIEKTCCSTCSKYRTGPAGCEYGDMRTWCPNLNPALCPTHLSICCVTCER